MTTAKSPKDKTPGSNPRLLPRQTAASAARAARNATNRNLTSVSGTKQSPTRTNPTSPKVKSVQRMLKSESKEVLNESHTELHETTTEKSLAREEDKYVINNTAVIIPETDAKMDCDGSATRVISEKHISDPIKEDNEVNVQEQLQLKDEPITTSLPNESRSRPITPVTSSRPSTPIKNMQSSRPQTPTFSLRPSTPTRPPSTPIQNQRPPTPVLQQRPPTPVLQQRPPTPVLQQRPSTPVHQLRPPTPVHQQRPSTPVHPQRPTTPISRPITPLSPSLCRAKAPSTNTALMAGNGSLCKDDDLKKSFQIKQELFHNLKKELDIKQQAVLEVFESLRSLRDRMSHEGLVGGGEGILEQDLVVFNVADWTAEEVSQLCRDAVAPAHDPDTVEFVNSAVPIDECLLDDLDAKVLNVPDRFANLCLKAFNARQEIIDWVKQFFEQNASSLESGCGESLEQIAQYNAQGLELCEYLRELKSCADNAIDTITQLSKRACKERTVLLTVGQALLREKALLQHELESSSTLISELQESRNELEQNSTLAEVRRELEEERAARVSSKDKVTSTESQLRTARARINKMDRQLREAEASIASLTGTVKSLEDQSRQRESQLEARARKLKESVKTGEVTSTQLAQHRDVLLNEIQDLKQQIETLTAQHKVDIKELRNQLKEAANNLEEQRKLTQTEIDLKVTAENELTASRNYIEELKAKITELELSIPNPDLPSEREMDLWAELQVTKDTLVIAEEEVTTCKREKVKFLETLTKITESEDKVGMQQKLAAELLSKEEVLGKMQMQTRELTKNVKLNEQKVVQYEQYIRDLQAHCRSVATRQKEPNSINYQDLQQEILNLRLGLLEAVHRNEQLTEQLSQRQLELEQQDKTSRAQARVIKVREELINMLKNKECEQTREMITLQQDLEHRMKVVDEVNKQIAAKAEEIQELFSTLENKQQQIHRLEKIVLALEEQQRRAEAQRTRQEKKIAALEHELAASGNGRERKFFFF